MTDQPPRRPATSKPALGRQRPRPADREPVLPDLPADETELGWGDEPSSRDVEWYRRERPPHHE